MRSLVTSIFLYACEAWTFTAELQRRIQAMEIKCYLKVLRISYEHHVNNEEVRAKIQQAIGPHEDLPTMGKRRKLQWYGHVSRSSGLARIIDTVKGGRRQGRQEEEVGKQHQGMDKPGIRQKSQRAVESRKNGGNWLRNHLRCPNRPRGQEIDEMMR